MENHNRSTASNYINNLLLARGLLRDGKVIEFAYPERAEKGLDGTMSQIMNLVHDLVLRRDRDSETLSSLSQTTAHLRTQSTAHTQTVVRLESEKGTLDRQLALVTARERSAQANLRSMENRNRALKEDMLRLKGTVAQIRTQCAADVRRRESELTRIKRHLEGRRGRDGPTTGQIGVVVVNPASSKTNCGARSTVESAEPADSSAYCLSQETNEFLTKLSQALSDENDALVALVRRTLSTLHDLLSLPGEGGKPRIRHAVEAMDGGVGFMDQAVIYETLASSTDEILDDLRSVLTNPSFVPLEEVLSREEEIHRLREGWEKMAVRWKEAVALMDGWKRRMVDEGDTINLEDLRDGLKLGNGLPTAQEAHMSPLKLTEVASAKETSTDFKGAAQRPASGSYQNMEFPEAYPPTTEDPRDIMKERSANVVPQRRHRKPVLSSPLPEMEERSRDDDDPYLDLIANENDDSMGTLQPARRRPSKQGQLPPESLSVAQKLECARSEAEEARQHEEQRAKTRIASRVVKKKLKGSRRRSTLSPEELEGLMAM